MSYQPIFKVSDRVRRHLQDIERLRSTITSGHILPAVEASVRHRASVESVHSSTSIEGNPLDINQVRAAISSDRVLTKQEYAEIEVCNYKQALDYIDRRRRSGGDIALDDILKLHQIITDRLLDSTRNGKFRHRPVYIENEQHQIIYTAVDAPQVKNELIDLLNWVKDNQFVLHPVIIGAIIHFHLAAIHPFSDGNGRTARATTALYLALTHYDNDGALTLDTYYASDRPSYYAILRRLNGENYTSSQQADLTPWLEYFTEGYLTSLRVLDAEIRLLSLATLTDKPALDRHDQDIISYAAKFGSLSISEAESILPELSRRTIQHRLKRLVDRGYLDLVGATHEAKYVLHQSD